MSLLKEFKSFAMRGNVIDLAVGVIIGGAFGKIVASLVADVIMPPIGLLVGGVNFVDLKWEMKAAEIVDGVEKAAVTLNYGNFLQVTFDFIIVAFAIFMFIKGMNKLNKKKEEAPAAPAPPPDSARSRTCSAGRTCSPWADPAGAGPRRGSLRAVRRWGCPDAGWRASGPRYRDGNTRSCGRWSPRARIRRPGRST